VKSKTNDVTKDFDVKIDGKTATATPKDATKYFFTGSGNDANRLLMHVTTVAENDVDADVMLTNSSTMTITNPKKPDDPQKLTSTARVHTSKVLVPEIQKAVSDDDGKTWTDMVMLDKQDTPYQYRITAKLPVNSIDASNDLSISDPLETVQSWNQDDVKVYAGIYTGQGKVEDEKDTKTGEIAYQPRTQGDVIDVTNHVSVSKDDQDKLKVSFDKAYVKAVRSSKTPVTYTVVLNGVNLKTASAEDLLKYKQGGLAYVPNVADLNNDGKTYHSNRVTVTPPNPLNPKDGSIHKALSLDNGDTWIANGQLPSKDAVYDYKVDVTAPVESNAKSVAISDIFQAGQTFDVSKFTVTDKDGKDITDQGTFTIEKYGDKEPTIVENKTAETTADVKSAESTTATDSSSEIKATSSYGDKAKADKAAKDEAAKAESSEAEKSESNTDEKVASKTTALKVGETRVIWTANKDLLATINGIDLDDVTKGGSSQTGYQMTLNAKGVTLAKATDEQLKAFIDKDGKLVVPNDADLLVTDQNDKLTTLKSNRVTITIPAPGKPVTPQTLSNTPGQPNNPVQQTLANTADAVKAHPLIAALGALLIAAGAGFEIKKLRDRQRGEN
jgi:hypothetical protein